MLTTNSACIRLSAFSLGFLLTAGSAMAQNPGVAIPAPPAVTQAFSLTSGTVQDLVLPYKAGTSLQADVILGGETRTLNLQLRDLRSPSFKLLIDDGSSITEGPRYPAVTYRGIVVGSPDSVVAVSILEGQMQGMVHLEEATWGIEPVNILVPGTPVTSHVVYRHADTTIPPNVTCGVTEGGEIAPTSLVGRYAAATVAIREADVALDCDEPFYRFNRFGNGSVSRAQSIATNILNGASAIYERDCDVRFKIGTIIVRTSPVYSGAISNRFNQFIARWRANHGNVPRDFAHLLSGVGGAFGVIGIARLSSICSQSNGFGSSQVGFTTNFNNYVGLVCHEAGHQFSSQHCSGGSCFIMCSSFGGCGRNMRRFSTNVANRIRNYANSRPCLTNVVQSAPQITNINPSSVTSHMPADVTLTGSDFTDVTEIQFGSATITNFTASASSLTFTPPSPFEINTHAVTAINPAGPSNSVNLDVTGSHPSILDAPPIHFSAVSEDYTVYTDKNWIAVYFMSTANGASAFPGIVTFEIGNGFTVGPFQITALFADDTGVATLPITLPAGLPPSNLYWEAVTYNPAALALPFETSNSAQVVTF